MRKGKVFGVALDASDDPFSLQLKQAAMDAREQGIEGLHADPYDALSEELTRGLGFEPAGRFPVPSWLGPLPMVSDRERITAAAMERFVEEGGVLNLIDDLRAFVLKRIVPAAPVMLGIDHVATAGVVSALSEQLGAENLTIIVLDRHFDALPLSMRIAAFPGGRRAAPPLSGIGSSTDALCCGNFWAHLIERRVVDPSHLVFLGVADYPAEGTPPEWAAFRRGYLSFEEQGCRFFPLTAFREGYEEKLRDFLVAAVTTPYVYVSLDLDVGAYKAVRAARYMDGPGVDTGQLLSVARIIGEAGRECGFSLAGLDVVEFNMHFLGLQVGSGDKDQTAEIAVEFVKTLVRGIGE